MEIYKLKKANLPMSLFLLGSKPILFSQISPTKKLSLEILG